MRTQFHSFSRQQRQSGFGSWGRPQANGTVGVDLGQFLQAQRTMFGAGAAHPWSSGTDRFQNAAGMGGAQLGAFQQMLTQLLTGIIQQAIQNFAAQMLGVNPQVFSNLGGGRNLGNLNAGQWGQMRGGPSMRGAPGAWSPGGAVNQNAGLPGGMSTGRGSVGNFLQHALNQKGDRYIFGAETRMSDKNPHTFDCSELVEWAAHQAGVKIPDGSGAQKAWVQKHGKQLSVAQALKTPGALLFRKGHVAISLGDGRTIEAKGRKYGVGIFNGRGRFTSGGLIPGMQYG